MLVTHVTKLIAEPRSFAFARACYRVLQSGEGSCRMGKVFNLFNPMLRFWLWPPILVYSLQLWLVTSRPGSNLQLWLVASNFSARLQLWLEASSFCF